MDVVAVIVALILIFIAWKVLVGLVKFGAIALVVIAAIWFVAQGGMA